MLFCFSSRYFAFWHSCLSERNHLTLTSYSRIPQLPPSDVVPFCRMDRYMERFSLPHTQPFAAARQIACDIWNHPRPFTCFSIVAGYRITHTASAYRVKIMHGILALPGRHTAMVGNLQIALSENIALL